VGQDRKRELESDPEHGCTKVGSALMFTAILLFSAHRKERIDFSLPAHELLVSLGMPLKNKEQKKQKQKNHLI